MITCNQYNDIRDVMCVCVSGGAVSHHLCFVDTITTSFRQQMRSFRCTTTGSMLVLSSPRCTLLQVVDIGGKGIRILWRENSNCVELIFIV